MSGLINPLPTEPPFVQTDIPAPTEQPDATLKFNHSTRRWTICIAGDKTIAGSGALRFGAKGWLGLTFKLPKK